MEHYSVVVSGFKRGEEFFRMTALPLEQVAEHRNVGIDGVEKPEIGDVRSGEVGQALILLAPHAGDGTGARAEDLDRVRAEWGLDRPWPVQYLAFAKNVFTGELGKSFNYQMPVSTLYFQRLPNSLELALAATLISFFIGIPAGIISAVRVNSGWDSFGKVVALLGLSIPGFWLGLVMILTFSVWLHWLPTSGQGGWRNLIMPAVALGWYFAASLLRLTRSSMLEVLRSEYVKLARLKGLPGYVVLAVHAFKNALIPVLTLAGVNLVVMINAAVIIEVIFAWPGIGRLLYEGIFQRDFPLVQGVVMEAGIMIVVINLVVDVLYAYIDPRIRLTK